ncbi:hypothetical protein, variant 3, partial [Aphanomyces astaci]
MSESNLLAVPSEAAVVDRLIAHCDGYDVRRQFEQFAAMFVRLAQSVGVLILSPAHFYASHADLFSDFDVGDEHSHDRHALFQAYEAMFESILNEFLTREQVYIPSTVPRRLETHATNVRLANVLGDVGRYPLPTSTTR